MTGFVGQKVVITGASSGIGKELARQWLALGAHVTAVADVLEKLDAAHAELRAISSAVEARVCDVSDLTMVLAFARDYVSRHGAPDIVVNNAGYAVYQSFIEMAPEEIARLIEVNFSGACFVTRAFLPSMQVARRGHLVMMTSIAGRVAMTPCGIYSAAKHGMVAFAETLRAEVASHNLHVHVVCPGKVPTDFFNHETFLRRPPRPEAQHWIPVQQVARATIEAVEHNHYMTYRPRSYRFVAWASQAIPLLSRPVLQRLMRARIEELSGLESRRASENHGQ